MVPTILWLCSLILGLMAVVPLAWMLSTAFKQQGDVFGAGLLPPHPTFDNFIYVFTQLDFIRFLFNTLFVSAVVTAAALLLHSMAGYALARLRFPGRETIFLTMFATFLVSLPVIIVPLFVLIRALGLLDSYVGLIVPAIFNAFGIFLLRQFYLGVPQEIEEAAIIDGAGYWRIYWSVILPLSRPILSALAILFFLANWNAFLWPHHHQRPKALGRAGRHRQLPGPVHGVVELHHGGLDRRGTADAGPVRGVPAPDHGFHQDHRPEIAPSKQDRS